MGVRAPEEPPEVQPAPLAGPPSHEVVLLGVVALLLLVSNGRPVGAVGGVAAAVAGKAIASGAVAAAAAFLFRALGRSNDVSQSRWAALLFALGTSAWAAAESLTPQALSLLAIAVAVFWMLRANDDPAWASRAGLPLGLAVAAWPPTLALACAMALGLVGRWPRKVLGLLAWGVPPAALRLALQPRLPDALGGGLADLGSTAGWGHLGLLISPERGLLVFSPIVLIAVAGLVHAWRSGEHWLAGTCLAGFAAHVALVGASPEWAAGAWGPVALTPALPLLLFFLPEGMALLPRAAALLALVSVAVQVLGAFAADGRWERLLPPSAGYGLEELTDFRRSPILFYAQRRVLILAVPSLGGGRVQVREHPFVVAGPRGSRFTFAGSGVVVKGADSTAQDLYLQGGARVDKGRLRIAGPADALFLRVTSGARIRSLELRVAGQGSGALRVEERTFWSAEPRIRDYPVASAFRIRHAYHYPESGGADLRVTVASGSVRLSSVSLVPPGDPDNPLQVP
jgi:hypothetical protein